MHRALDANRMVPPGEFNHYIAWLMERSKLLCTPLFLTTAWSLFQHHGVTPFADAEIVTSYMQQVLDEWDRRKQVVRERETWASPESLKAVLEEISFRLVKQRSYEFRTQDFETWFRSRAENGMDASRVLRFLSEQSGVICNRAGSWEADDRLVDYLAARYVVSSGQDPTELLEGWGNEERPREVLRLTCGMLSDATPVLRNVIDKKDVSTAGRALMLANIVAQPIRADADMLEETCHQIVVWLDPHLEGWQLQNPERGDLKQPEYLWTLRATRKKSSKDAQRAWNVITPLHQARSGPARDHLRQRLSIANAPVLRALRESMDVDGELKIDAQPNYTDVSARVVAPL